MLNDLFYPDDGMNHVIDPELEEDTKEDQSYDEVVKKFIKRNNVSLDEWIKIYNT